MSCTARSQHIFVAQDVFEQTMNLNYMGNVNVIKAVAPYMVAQQDGDILIVARLHESHQFACVRGE